MLMAGIYEYYKANAPERQNYGLYHNLSLKTLYAERGVFTVVINAAVYVSGIAIIVSVSALAIEARGNNQKLSEAKNWIMRVLIISLLIFAVTGGIMLIQEIGMD